MTASITEQLVQAIAERRGISREKVSELIDAGPYLAARAQAEGLVDQLGYRDEVYAEARKLAGPDAAVALPRPVPARPRPSPSGPGPPSRRCPAATSQVSR